MSCAFDPGAIFRACSPRQKTMMIINALLNASTALATRVSLCPLNWYFSRTSILPFLGYFLVTTLIKELGYVKTTLIKHG